MNKQFVQRELTEIKQVIDRQLNKFYPNHDENKNLRDEWLSLSNGFSQKSNGRDSDLNIIRNGRTALEGAETPEEFQQNYDILKKSIQRFLQ